MRSINNILSVTVFCMCGILLYGCDAPMTETMAPDSDHRQVTISAGTNINGKLALQVDLVQAYSKNVFDSLKSMDATMFRSKKEQMLLDNPDDMAIWSFDFTNGQVATYSFPIHKNYWGIVIYLHFIDNPQNRIILPQTMNSVRLQIEEGRFKITKEGKHVSGVKLENGGN